jgi:hypothetical protein
MTKETFYFAPIEFLVMAFEDVPTKDLINLISEDELLSYRLLGREFPPATTMRLAGMKRLIDFNGMTPKADVMLLLLRREFGLTADERYIACLQQFRAKLVADFTEWLNFGDGKTVAGVAKLFNAMFFEPVLPTKLLVSLPLVFAWTGKQLIWRSFISLFSQERSPWNEAATLVPTRTVNLRQLDSFPKEITRLAVGELVRGVPVSVFLSDQLQRAPGTPRRVHTILLADDADSDGSLEPVPRAPYIRSLYDSKRTDAASAGTTCSSTLITYHRGDGTVTSADLANAKVHYCDYESVVTFEPSGFSVLYKCTPANVSRAFTFLSYDDIRGQLRVITPRAVSGLTPLHLSTCRIDAVAVSEPFSVAVAWTDQRDTFIEIIEALDDGNIVRTAKYVLPTQIGKRVPNAFVKPTLSGTADVIVLSVYTRGSALGMDDTEETRPFFDNIVTLDRTTNMLTVETWSSDNGAPSKMFPRADLRRTFYEAPDLTQNLVATRLI